jgi:HSP90 family molecular chaperone
LITVSSFLVADQVTVASIPPKSSKHPNPSQSVFSSTTDEGTFEVYPDPRGNTLGHGTEITLELKTDAKQYLVTSNLMKLMYVYLPATAMITLKHVEVTNIRPSLPLSPFIFGTKLRKKFL